MPGKKGFSKNTLSKAQKKEVNKIVDAALDEEIEDKRRVVILENQQLFHNIPLFLPNILSQIEQGINDGNQGTGASGLSTIRIGDRISIKNLNFRFWLSNKSDRPNVMYKACLFWYASGTTLTNALVYNTQTNKILDRYNRTSIQVLDSFLLNSTYNYAATPADTAFPLFALPGREKSMLATLNKSYKMKKIDYDDNTNRIKDKELGIAIVAYDAYGTLQTDNIASFAVSTRLTFQDA